MFNTKTVVGKKIPHSAERESSPDILGQFKLGESYTSLVIGIVVVVVLCFLGITFLKRTNAVKINSLKQEVSSTSTKKENGDIVPTYYIVVEGDTLGGISDTFYNTSKRADEIIKANNIINPDVIEAGTKLLIPDIDEKQILSQQDGKSFQTQTQDAKITESFYVVKEGEGLWDIAVRAYGDGYKWPDIVKANNLQNPDIITPGTTIKIPR